MKTNSHILRISGAAELPKELTLGNNYTVTITGAVTKTEDVDNHDGSYDKKYTIKPILVELVDDKGESIKAKDTRGNSQLQRGINKKLWLDHGAIGDFEEFHDKMYSKFRKFSNQFADEIFK